MSRSEKHNFSASHDGVRFHRRAPEELELLRPQPTYPHWADKQSQIINAAHNKCVERNELRAKYHDLQDKYKKDMEEKDAQLKAAHAKPVTNAWRTSLSADAATAKIREAPLAV